MKMIISVFCTDLNFVFPFQLTCFVKAGFVLCSVLHIGFEYVMFCVMFSASY